MKLFGVTFKYLSVLMVVILLYNVQLSKIEDTLSDMNEEKLKTTELLREMTKEEQRSFDKIRKPDAPTEIPEDLRFMEKEMGKAYQQARFEANPRFKEAESLNNQFMTMFPPDRRKLQPIIREG